MNKTILIVFSISLSVLSFGQAQIGNGDMETWENLGAPTEEPINWNGIKTASGNSLLISFAPQAITRSIDTRTGSGYSSRLVANSVLTTIANGTMSIGQINVGNATATDPSNYAWSNTSDPAFSEAMIDAPDSLVFWAKFTPINGNDIARMKATLHDAYDYIDPEDAVSSTHVVATAILNYPSTVGNWVRKSVPFIYSGPASGNTNILITFTTNELAGGGSGNDEVLIDDVELIYNPTGIQGITIKNTFVSLNNESNRIHISSSETIYGDYKIYDMKGNVIQNGAIADELNFEHKTGMYIVVLNIEGRKYSFKIMKN